MSYKFDPNSILRGFEMTDKDHSIYEYLQDGFSIKQTAGLLECSTATVQKIRKRYPEQFPPAAPRVGNQCQGRPKTASPSVPLSVRVPAWIFARIKSEIIDLGLTKSGFINGLLDARYKGQDIYNGFEAGGECSHEPGDVVRNHNSNHDRDEFVCSRCGAKLEKGR